VRPDPLTRAGIRACTPDEVRAAVAEARGVQSAWAALPLRERARRMDVLRRVLGRRGDDIARVVHEETGKPLAEALAEVVVIADVLGFYGRHARRVLGARRVGTGWLVGKTARVEREPFGVVGAITPWNYPFILTMDAVAAALYAGNAIVLKPSEYTPRSALIIEELAREAGLPAGLVRVVPGGGEAGQALVSAGVDKLFFTGSTETGRRVMAAAAETLTPVGLELGGKDPAIVLEDADLDRTAAGLAYGAFFNAGQTCVSTERVYVVEAVHDALVERLVAEASRLTVGAEGDYDIGPMVTDFQVDIVEAQVRDALARGARVEIGGERAPDDTRIFQPTVLTGVDHTMAVMTEETFGPLLPVMRVRDEDEAVRLANQTPYGLFASVWTGNLARGRRVAARLRAGGVSINDTLSHYAVPGLPMGGTGASGFGRRRGEAGLEEMSRPRAVLEHRVGLRRELWWFPYRARTSRIVRALLQVVAGSGVGRFVRALRALRGEGR